MIFRKKKIARIRGDNPELAVRNASKHILTDEVAIRYSWTGQKQMIKFSQHKIVDGIVGNEKWKNHSFFIASFLRFK